MLFAALIATAAGIDGSLELMWGHFAIGGALILVSVLALRTPRSIWGADAPAELAPRTRRLALLGVCAVAVFFRVYRLNQPGLWGDDALNGLLAFDILDGKITSPFQLVRHSHSTFHALSNYPIAAAFWLFGADLTTLRLPGIVLGALCVPLLYATMAPLFGSPVALLAALFYASAPPQLTHAKQLVQIITGQFFQLAGLCLLVRGLAARRTWLVIAAGLPLAACVYTYHAAKLAPLVALVYGLAVLSTRGRAGPRRALSVTLATTLALFVLALLPAALGYLQNPDALIERVGDTSIWVVVGAQHSLWPLWDAVWRTLLMFHYQQGPEYHWFGIGYDPAVNVLIGFLLVQGLVESLAHWRAPRHLLLLAWLMIGLVPGFLSSGAPRLYRALLATPPIYVWAALPLTRLLAVPVPGRSRALVRGVAAALIVAVPLIDFNYYFYRVYTHPLFRWFQGERLVEMARTLRSFGPGWTGYLLTDTYDASHETLRFLSRAWGLQMRDVASLADVLPLRDPPERGALFIMSQATLEAAPAIEQMYPGAELLLRREPAPRSWWLDAWWPLAPAGAPRVSAGFYPVRRADAEHPRIDPPHGLLAEYDLRGIHLARVEPYPFYAFFPPTFPLRSDVPVTPAERRSDAVWRGRLTIPPPGDFRLFIESNASATISLDGHTVGWNDPLPAGEHELAVQLHSVPDHFHAAIFWQPPGESHVLVPPDAFAPAATSTAPE
jgi:4-amino-4-deoxy-L-arabinose transferase-like glycosyltransferase